MFEDGISDRWVRRAGMVICAFFGFFAVLSLGYVWYAAADGQVLRAVIGAGGALGSLGLGTGMYCMVQVVSIVGRNDRRIDGLQRQVDGLILLVEQTSGGLDRSGPADEDGESEGGAAIGGGGDPSSLVAGDVRRGFPRLIGGVHQADADDVSSAEAGVSSKAVGAMGKAADRRETDRCETQAGAGGDERLPQLRASFRRAVFARDFAKAIEAGEVMLHRYPNSAEAQQYRELAPMLDRFRSGLSGVRAS